MSIVVPAVLPSSRADLREKLALFARIPGVSRVQIDVVDGRFATPASWPYNAPAEFQTMISHTQMLPRLERIEYEVDLMCIDVERAAAAWLALGATRLTFHAESTNDLPRLLVSVRRLYGEGTVIAFGLALNISSDLALIEQNVDHIQYVQFMGIARVGRQGQPFDKRVVEKVRVFRDRHPQLPVQVDGGISLEHAKKLVSLGVKNLVIGSSILEASDPGALVSTIDALSNPYGV